MRRLPRLVAVGVGTLLVPWAGGASGQSPTEDAEGVGVHTELVRQVAERWGVDDSRVDVRVLVGIPDGVDSVRVAESSPSKWIATFYTRDRSFRRFIDVGHVALVEVAAAPLRRGTTVESSSIEHAIRVVPGPPGDPGPSAVGMVAERTLRTGDVLRHPAVRPPYVVRGGDEVEAVLEQGVVTMTLLGEALGAARAGELVQVRLATGVRRRARAIADGVVTLIPGGS